MEELSQIRQKIYQLNQKRWALLENVMKPGKLLTASFYARMTKCSNPNCKCAFFKKATNMTPQEYRELNP